MTSCSDTATQTVTIVAQDFRFVPAEVRVSADRPVRLAIRNEGREPHIFASPLLALARPAIPASLEVPPGKTAEVELRLPAGTYAFRCARRGHAGMEGLLIAEPSS